MDVGALDLEANLALLVVLRRTTTATSTHSWRHSDSVTAIGDTQGSASGSGRGRHHHLRGGRSSSTGHRSRRRRRSRCRSRSSQRSRRRITTNHGRKLLTEGDEISARSLRKKQTKKNRLQRVSEKRESKTTCSALKTDDIYSARKNQRRRLREMLNRTERVSQTRVSM